MIRGAAGMLGPATVFAPLKSLYQPHVIKFAVIAPDSLDTWASIDDFLDKFGCAEAGQRLLKVVATKLG